MHKMKTLLLMIASCILIACGGSGGDSNGPVASLSDIAGVWNNGSDDSYTVFDSTGFQNISKRAPAPSIGSPSTNTNCYDMGPKVTLTQVADGKFNASGNTSLGNDKTIKSMSLKRNAEALRVTFNVQQISPDTYELITVQHITTVYPTSLKVSDIKPICDS